jgi:hypothetical protein
MSRLFDGVDDQMVFAQPAGPPAMNDAFTLVIVVRIMTASDNTWLSLLEFQRADNNPCCTLLRTPAASPGELWWGNTNGGSIGSTADVTISDADSWMLLAASRTTGAATTLYKRILSSGTKIVQTGTALADGLAWNTGGTFRIGGNSDFANIRVAAAGYISGTALSEGQLDGLDSTQDLIDLAFTAVYDDSDAFATDLAGSADRSSVTGTTDDADDPANWTYFGGGGTDATVDLDTANVVMDATGDLVTPAVSGDANATVTAPVMDALGDFPDTGMVLSVDVVLTAPMAATGAMRAPTVTGTGNQTVTSPVADAAGDLPVPSLTADSAVTAPVADATGDLTAPAVAAGSTITSPAIDAAGDLLAPIVGEPVDLIRLGTVSTGAAEVPSRATRRTGGNEPAHFTGATEPAHATGGTEQITLTGAAEVVLV